MELGNCSPSFSPFFGRRAPNACQYTTSLPIKFERLFNRLRPKLEPRVRLVFGMFLNGQSALFVRSVTAAASGSFPLTLPPLGAQPHVLCEIGFTRTAIDSNGRNTGFTALYSRVIRTNAPVLTAISFLSGSALPCQFRTTSTSVAWATGRTTLHFVLSAAVVVRIFLCSTYKKNRRAFTRRHHRRFARSDCPPWPRCCLCLRLPSPPCSCRCWHPLPLQTGKLC